MTTAAIARRPPDDNAARRRADGGARGAGRGGTTRDQVRRAPRPAIGRFDAVAAEVSASEPVLVERLSAQLPKPWRFASASSAPRTDELTPTAAARTSSVSARTRSPSRAASSIGIADAAPCRAPRGRRGCGVGIARFADVAHGYWIALTVLMVLRPETAHTYTRCVGRIGRHRGRHGGGYGHRRHVRIRAGLVAPCSRSSLLGVAYAVSGFGYVAVSAALAAAIVFLDRHQRGRDGAAHSQRPR